MPTGQFYYLVLVCAAFAVFAGAVMINYIQYRRWLKQQPGTRS
jgi:hypothetical protein